MATGQTQMKSVAELILGSALRSATRRLAELALPRARFSGVGRNPSRALRVACGDGLAANLD